MKMLNILLASLALLLGCTNLGNEITQYIAIKDGKKLTPLAKITYKVFPEKQEVIYWFEVPGETRSSLYNLRHCKISDSNNWEGEQEYSSIPLGTRIEYVNGKFNDPIIGNNIGWWDWHFNSDPKPSALASIGGGLIIGLAILGLLFSIKEKLGKNKDNGS